MHPLEKEIWLGRSAALPWTRSGHAVETLEALFLHTPCTVAEIVSTED
jgi:hypothetical protein